MDKIKIEITGRVASVVALPEVVADNAEYEVDFALDPREGWDMSLPITALFVRRDGSYTARILDAGATSCTMPPQTGTNIVYVGLTQDDMRATTPAAIKVQRSIRTVANDPLPAPTEDVYAQILAAYAGIKILSGRGAPTSATQGKVNQLYRDESTDKLYICTGVEGGYTWAAVVSDTEDAVTYTAQTLTNAQKTQARANIGAGTSNFSGSYNDLNDKPNIPAATVIDTTLTKSGQAADAKAAGDAIGKKIDAPQVAQVGEVLAVEAVDAEGKPTKWKTAPAAAEQKQADWNQNDETAADYVKNRTHYTKKDTVLEYGVLSGFEDDGSGMYYYVLPYVLDIYVGLKVEVTWDNQVYQLTAIQPTDGIAFIGNNSFLNGEDSGEPFGIFIDKLRGMTSVVSTGTETSHEVGIVAKSPVRIEPYFLPTNIAYLQNGFFPLNLVIPSAEDVFGGPIYVGGTESTLENPYRNKHTLNNLTLETFNKMLVGTVYLPRSVLVDDKNIASVSALKNNGYIRVLWSSYTTYSIQGYALAGARIEIYDARIHEDADNPGTIVSEYAKILVANKQLT